MPRHVPRTFLLVVSVCPLIQPLIKTLTCISGSFTVVKPPSHTLCSITSCCPENILNVEYLLQFFLESMCTFWHTHIWTLAGVTKFEQTVDTLLVEGSKDAMHVQQKLQLQTKHMYVNKTHKKQTNKQAKWPVPSYAAWPLLQALSIVISPAAGQPSVQTAVNTHLEKYLFKNESFTHPIYSREHQ